MLPISGEQKKMIHTIKAQLGMDEETYKEILWSAYKVDSSTRLSRQEARELIDMLKKSAVQAGVWTNNRGFKKYKYDNLGKREGMASPKQLRMIESMWQDVSFVKEEKARLEALDTFLSNHFGVDKLIWVESEMVSKIVNTLKTMRTQKNEQMGKKPSRR